jgi:hypothetical protein
VGRVRRNGIPRREVRPVPARTLGICAALSFLLSVTLSYSWFHSYTARRTVVEPSAGATKTAPTIRRQPAASIAGLPGATDTALDAPSSSLIIRGTVVDPDRRPVDGAIVYIEDESDTSFSPRALPALAECSTTSPQGGFELASDRLEGRRLTVLSPAHISWSASMRTFGAEPILVVLEYGGSISGRIVVRDPPRSGMEFTVCAWPDTQRILGAASLAAAASGIPRACTTRSAVDGTFRLTGLDPALRYRLSAGGTGYVDHGVDSGGVSASVGDDVEIRLLPLHALSVVFVELSGEPLALSPELYPVPSTSVNCRGVLHQVSSEYPGVTLATMTSIGATGLAITGHSLELAWVVGDSRDAPVARIYSNFPGYLPTESEVPLANLAAGPLQVHRIPLTNFTPDRGSLRVVVDLVDPDCRRAFDMSAAYGGMPALLLRIRPRGWELTGTQLMERAITSLGATDLVGLPAGDYDVALVDLMGSSAGPAPAIANVRVGTRASVSFDLSSYGGIAIDEASLSAIAPTCGRGAGIPIHVTFNLGGRTASIPRLSRGQRFALFPMSPGTRGIRIVARDGSEASVGLVVKSGAVTTVAVSAQDFVKR